MSIEGVWTGEVYGPFGWDSRGVFIFERGRIIGGDHRQYSSGSYSQSGPEVKARITVHYYGPPQPAFGELRERFTTELEGRLEGPEDQRRDPPAGPAPVRSADPPDQAHGSAGGVSGRPA